MRYSKALLLIIIFLLSSLFVQSREVLDYQVVTGEKVLGDIQQDFGKSFLRVVPETATSDDSNYQQNMIVKNKLNQTIYVFVDTYFSEELRDSGIYLSVPEVSEVDDYQETNCHDVMEKNRIVDYTCDRKYLGTKKQTDYVQVILPNSKERWNLKNHYYTTSGIPLEYGETTNFSIRYTTNSAHGKWFARIWANTVDDWSCVITNTCIYDYTIDPLWTQGSSGVTGAYNFDEGSGTTVADQKAFAGTMNLSGNYYWTTNGTIYNATHFNGTSSGFGIIPFTAIRSLYRGSINMWVKGNDTGNSPAHEILNFGTNAGSSYTMRIGRQPPASAGQIYYQINATFVNTNISYILTNHTWLMLTLTWNSTHAMFYYNGTIIDTTAIVGGTGANSDFYIAKSMNPSNTFWNGDMDLLTIWNRTLTQGEITSLYNNQQGLLYPFTTAPQQTIQNRTSITIQQGNNVSNNSISQFVIQTFLIDYGSTSNASIKNLTLSAGYNTSSGVELQAQIVGLDVNSTPNGSTYGTAKTLNLTSGGASLNQTFSILKWNNSDTVIVSQNGTYGIMITTVANPSVNGSNYVWGSIFNNYTNGGVVNKSGNGNYSNSTLLGSLYFLMGYTIPGQDTSVSITNIFNNPVLETSLQNVTINFTMGADVVDVDSANLTYNGRVYTGLQVDAGVNYKTYTAQNVTVQLIALNNTNITFNWTYHFSDDNNTNYTNTSANTNTAVYWAYVPLNVNGTLNVTETKTANYNATFFNTLNTSGVSFTYYVIWNSTNLSGTTFALTPNLTTQNFTQILPFVATSGNNQTVNITSSINITFNGTSLQRNGSRAQQTLNRMVLNDCNSLTKNISVQYSIRDFLNNSLINTATFQAALSTWTENFNLQRNYSVNSLNNASPALCMFPTYETLNYNLQSLLVSAGGYNSIQYYNTNATANSTQQNITLFLIPSSNTTNIQYTVVDTTDQPLQGYRIDIYSYSILSGNSTFLQTIITDSNGHANASLILNQYYIYKIFDPSNNLVLTVPYTFLTSTQNVFVIGIIPQSPLQNWINVNSLNYNLTFTNVTNTSRYDWNDPTLTLNITCLTIVNLSSTNLSIYNRQCSANFSGTFSIVLPSNYTWLEIASEVNANDSLFHIVATRTDDLRGNSNGQIFGVEGGWWASAFLLVLVPIGATSAGGAYIAVVLVAVWAVMVSIYQLIPLGYTVVMTLITMALMYVMSMRREE